jgi:hypothetical protein
MASDRVIKVRDDLNRLIDKLTEDESDQEGHVMSCCIALAVEEIEKWMYNGEFTPSVAPYREGKDLKPKKKNEPRQVSEDELIAFGPPLPTPASVWNSTFSPVKPPVYSANNMPASTPIFEKLRIKAEAAPIRLKTFSFLNTLAPEDWNLDMMKAFREGSRERFFNSIKMFPSSPSWLSVTEVMNYVNKMIEVYPHLWSVDSKGKV